MLNRSFTAAAVCLLAVAPAYSQVFADIKSALVDYSNAELAPKKTCQELSAFKANEIVQIRTSMNSASEAKGVSTPAYCRVTGMLSPEIAFEVSLPAKWNGRFYMIGNGGLAGQSIDGSANERTQALRLGFAFAQTNTGHDATKEPGGTFVLSNKQKAIDYAYRAVHLTAVTAKNITKDYYGKPIAKSYWNSCSNGGRQGMLEAQRYPDDFDGIIANAPWVDQTGFTVASMWNQKALTETSLPVAKLTLVANAVMAKCDAVDGLKDGLIDDPRKCSFNPAVDVPACKTTDAADCLTPPQASAIAKVYSGPVSNGKPFFTGYMLGSEALLPTGASGWNGMIVGANATAKPADFNLAEGIVKYLVFSPPKVDYDYKTFDFDKDIHLLDNWSKLADAKDPDLSKLKKRGGKIIMTYGWADPVLEPMAGVKYYESVQAKDASVQDYFRLFMIPGMGHCSGGIGTDRLDSMTAIINWVEKGQAPASIPASRAVNGTVVRTRPLCPYPQVAKYSGQGSIDEAKNFSCVAP